MTTYPRQTRRWTRADYDRLIGVGVFRPGEPVELLGGELIVAEPQESAHYTAIGLVEDALRAAFGEGWLVRSQGPLALIAEVAGSSLQCDREHKGSLYPRARVEDYWILDLGDRALEVYREPVPDASARFGWRYASRRRLHGDGVIAPLAAPAAPVRVADLLP